MTYDELIDWARGGGGEWGPLIDPERPDAFEVTDEGLVIFGSLGRDVGETSCSDMRIRLENGRFRAWMRDPAGAEGEDVFHGPEWTAERLFDDFDTLVTWAYSW